MSLLEPFLDDDLQPLPGQASGAPTGRSASLLSRVRLGEIWVEMGKITQEQLDNALAEQKRTDKRLGRILEEKGLINSRDIAEARAIQYDVPFCDLTVTKPDPAAIALLPAAIALSLKVLPVQIDGNRIKIALSNPNNVEDLDQVQRASHLKPVPMFADEVELHRAIELAYGTATNSGKMLEAVLDDLQIEREEETLPDDFADVVEASGQAPVIKMVNLLILEAVRMGASDIHLEPRANGLEVRYRVDGVLRKSRTLPRQLQAPCISRLKIMAEVDIAEKRLPQDGRIPVVIDDRPIDLRLSTLPIYHGERVVMRVLDKNQSIRSISVLDFSKTNQERFLRLVHKPFGIILVTGPTGSGKTTTLYSALGELMNETTNIITCEDPIEYDITGINQSAVNPRAGLTFAKQLRAILRQDPDVVLVGEIRDLETAEIAFRAAMTGHLVLSTLHANDAATTVTRLTDMGVPAFLSASGLAGVVAQRLVRKLCPDCREQQLPDPVQAEALGIDADKPVWVARGCDECHGRGYKGRLPVHEVMICNEKFGRLVMRQESGDALRAVAAENGMLSLRDDAVEKIYAGLTTVDEAIKKVSLAQ